MKRVDEHITEKDVKDFCRDCNEFCSRHCVIWRKAENKYNEQEPILDKIREEIEKLQKMCDKNDLNLMAQYSAFGMVLDIFDKYKAESEGEE